MADVSPTVTPILTSPADVVGDILNISPASLWSSLASVIGGAALSAMSTVLAAANPELYHVVAGGIGLLSGGLALASGVIRLLHLNGSTTTNTNATIAELQAILAKLAASIGVDPATAAAQAKAAVATGTAAAPVAAKPASA